MELNFFTIMLLSFGVGGIAILVGYLIVKFRDLKRSKEIYYDVEASMYGLELRKLNEKIIKKNKIPYDKTLPMYLYDREYAFKDKETILKRAICLYFVIDFAKSFDKNDNQTTRERKANKLKNKLKSYSLTNNLTEKEKELIEKPTELSCKKMCFEQESLLVLTWALSLIEDIELPFKQCEFEIFDKIYGKKTQNDLLELSSLRTDSELVKLNDLNFLCQWACNEEIFVGKRLSKLNPEVTNERFRASIWLVCNSYIWDKIDTSA